VSLLNYSLVLALFGATLLLDKWSFGEFGLSQPIVACSLIGLACHDYRTGLFLGTALQLIWIEALPLGSGKPLDYQAAGVVGATSYFFARKLYSLQPLNTWPLAQNRVLFLSIILAALATIVGQFTDDRVKKFNSLNYRWGITARSPLVMSAAHLSALLTQYLRVMLVIAFFFTALYAVRPFISRLPDFTRAELLFLPLAIGIAGLADLFLLVSTDRRRRTALFLAGAALSAVIWILWR